MLKDYFKEMEELLNPMKKIYDEMNPMKNILDSLKPANLYGNLYSNDYLSAIIKAQKEAEYTLSPMKNILDSLKSANSYDNLYSNDYLSAIIKAQKEAEELLNPMKKIYDEMNPYTNIYPTSNVMSSFEEFQKKIEYDLNPLKQLQDQMEYISNPFKRIQDEMNLTFLNSLNQSSFLEKSISPMKNAVEALKLMNNSPLSKIEELNEILKSLNLPSIAVEETIQNKVEEQIDSLTKEDKKSLEEIFDSLKYIFPDISYLSEKLSKREYIAILIFIIFNIPTIYSFYEEHFKQNLISDSYYKINRNNVRVRTEPSTNSTSNIIVKLNKNVFVEKIDSHRNWLKIEFEDDNGEEKQGWIRCDMLTKIENE